MPRLVLMLLLVIASVPACASAPADPGLSAESLWQWEWAGQARLAPDGKRLVYVRTRVDAAEDAYDTALWLQDPERDVHRALTTREASHGSPRWSPGGERIAFVSDRSGKSQIWVLDLAGGEARQLTRLPDGAGAPVWSPDGERIAFSSRSRTPAEKDEDEAEKRTEASQARTARELGDDEAMVETPEPAVITELQYQSDGRPGYLPDRASHLWVVTADPDSEWPREVRRITSGEHDHGRPAWSADGRHLYFSSLLAEDADWRVRESHIYRVAADGEGDAEQLTQGRRSRGRPRVSPEGDWIAFTGSEYRETPASYGVTDLYVMPSDGGEERRLTANYDRGVGDGTSGDLMPPTGSGERVMWSPDGEFLWFTTAANGETHLARIARRGGAVERMTAYEQGDAREFSLAGDTVALLWSDPTRPYDLYRTRPSGLGESPADWSAVTRLNRDVLEGRSLSGYQSVQYESFDGREIEGWVIRPPGFDPDREYPALLYIHGGPHAMYGTTFFHEFQTLANAGYVVFITNPRGSSGYGNEFGNIIQYRYPGDDYRDLMAGTDWLAEQPWVDASRLGVAGGSGGGLLTTWTITQTDRFAAAAAQRSVTNWHSFVGTADMNLYFVEAWFSAAPWEEPMQYIDRSPLAYVDQVETPLLMIHSEQDWRTPLEQTRQFFTHLRMQEKPARMVLFPESSHGLSRTGRPGLRVSRLRHIQRWFDEHLAP